MLTDTIVVHSKHRLRWLHTARDLGGKMPRTPNDEMYDVASQLSELSLDYLSFESPITYASLGIVELTLEQKTIIDYRR